MGTVRMLTFNFLLWGFLFCALEIHPANAQTNNTEYKFLNLLHVKSEILNEDRVISVYLPASYEYSADHYPVLVILDAEDFFHPFAGMVSYYSKIGKCPELLIVGIDTKDRWRDYTPTHAQIPDGTPLPTSGASESFNTFIRYEVMKLLESKYRISPFHILFGHSIAGLFVVHSVFDEQSNFSGFIATSPSLWWDNELIAKKAKASYDLHFSHTRYLFFTIGNEGPTMLDPVLNFKTSIEGYNAGEIAWSFEHYDNVDHQTMPIKAFIYGLEFIFSDWQMPQDQFEQGLPAIIEYYENLSRKYLQEIIPPETTINRLGYLALHKDRADEAIKIFQYNIRLYPNSANVYDSMGEAYLTTGDSTQAVIQYKKSLKLNPNNRNAEEIILKLESR